MIRIYFKDKLCKGYKLNDKTQPSTTYTYPEYLPETKLLRLHPHISLPWSRHVIC